MLVRKSSAPLSNLCLARQSVSFAILSAAAEIASQPGRQGSPETPFTTGCPRVPRGSISSPALRRRAGR